MEDAVNFLKCLADQTRIDILNILVKKDSYVELIATKLNLTPGTVCYHLKKMENAGIVRCSRTQFYVIYSLNREIFEQPLSRLLFTEDQTMDREMQYRQKVLGSFFVNGRLVAFPSQQKKREIILEKIAESFEVGRLYKEKELNHILLDFFDDFCTLRRELIAFGFMERENEIYWRTPEKQSGKKI